MKGNSQSRYNVHKFRKEFRTETGFYWTPGLFVATTFIVILVVGGLGLAVYYTFFSVDVATSGIRGAGEQTKQVNSAQNRADWENHFAQLKTSYEAQVKQIPGAEQAIKDWDAANGQKPDPFGTLAEQRQSLVIDLKGLRDLCHTNAQTFNTDSERTKVGAQFKGSNMPDTLNDSACNR